MQGTSAEPQRDQKHGPFQVVLEGAREGAQALARLIPQAIPSHRVPMYPS